MNEISKGSTHRQVYNDIHCEEINLLRQVHKPHVRLARNIFLSNEINEVAHVFVDGWFEINILLSSILSCRSAVFCDCVTDT
jgi:hypothetical protein